MQYRLLVILLLCHLTQSTKADSTWTFKHLDSGEGMSLIKSITKDSEGFLWIGNDGPGLMRYDGYNIERFLNNPDDSTSISSNKIFQLFVDSKNRLWICTHNGLNLYHPSNESFTRYLFNNIQNNSNDPFSVNCIFEDSEKNLWIGADDGLRRYNESSKTFTHYKMQHGNSLSQGITSIEEADNDKLFISTYISGLFIFNKNTHATQYYPHRDVSNIKEIKTLHLDKNNLLWILSRLNGLSYFNPDTQTFVDIPISDDGKGTNGSRIMDVYEDDSNNLYFAVDQGGINKLDQQTITFKYLEDQKNGLTSNGIYSFHKDNNGILWVGTSRGGVFYYNPNAPIFHSYKKSRFQHATNQPAFNNLAGNIIGCFHEDNLGKIWIGTDGKGISIFNPKNDKFLNIRNRNEDDNYLPSNVIRSIVSDSQDHIWLGTWKSGISKYNNKLQKFIPWPNKKDSLLNEIPQNIWSLFIDSKNNLWMSFEDGRILRYDIDSKTLHKFTFTHPKEVMDLPYFYEFKKGEVLTSNSSGIYKINQTNKKIDDFIILEGVTTLAIDAFERYWVGTSNDGVKVFNSQLEEIKHFNTNNKLLDNSISGIISNNDTNIWIATLNGLYCYDGNENILLSYFKPDGLQGNQFFLQSTFQSSDGTIYLGGTDGFTFFNPSQIKINKENPRVIINSILVDNELLTFKGQNSEIETHPRYCKHLELPFNHSILNLKFNAITFNSPEKCKYKYRLKGFSSNWTETTARNRTATFTNLHPGEYTFEILSTNSDGIWSTNINTLKISIKPPFWQRLWFIAIIIAVIIAFFRLYIFLRERRLMKDRKELREAVNLRTKIIEDQKEELLAQNEELMIHRQNLETIVETRTEELKLAKEKAEEGNRLKSAFLANMSHEIRTPMNAIVGFSDLISENDLTSNERKAYSDLIKTNTDSLLVLIEDILDISKIEANQLPISKSEYNIYESLETLFNTFLVQIKNPNIQLILQNSLNHNEIFIKADQYRINQIIANFLNNAIKFTEKGIITISLETNDENLIISVKDTGPGLSKKEKDMIFIPFFKLPKDEKNLKRGVGLGLAISKQLSALMGYEIKVSSEINKGSKFSLFIPKSELLEYTKKRMSSFR
ncbi:two-component regulator propeller domain-containing protein [Carboxylicivirga linearis]|uniref:histidine kinase n=1 Tax=Carboxylicivirga linearis TaxID=1628157 RepID=A0ABS5JU55_9BACT|nr:two-component regulator propeller domain-containing protein [Carboxylicivirga linearis]MBS2098448.1 hypothetical protein [Carboxylicivirga linearis]